MGQRFESRDVTRVERGVVGLVVVGGAQLVIVACLIVTLRFPSGITNLPLLLWMFTAALFVNLWRGSLERTTVRANRQGLWVGDEFVPAAAILGVRAYARRGLAMVRVSRLGLHLPIDLGVRDAAEGERLMRALDLDGAGRDDPEIGADGILLRSGGRRRYIHHGRLDRVSAHPAHPDRIDLLLKDGEHLSLPCRPGLGSATLQQIERARAACASDAGEAFTPEASRLQRGNRGLRAWIEQLRAVGMGAHAAHRVAPVPPDRLWRIVESAGSRPLLRVAAAVALGPRLDARDRDRLRAAASNTTSPRLRVALERAASAAPETELSALLAGVEEDDAPGNEVPDPHPRETLARGVRGA